MTMTPEKENPGARAGALGAEIVQFSESGQLAVSLPEASQQPPSCREGFDAGRQDMLDELVRGRDVSVVFERLGPHGAARLCLYGDAPLDDWSTAFLCDVAERTRFTLKQQAKLRSLVGYCLNYGGFQHDAL